MKAKFRIWIVAVILVLALAAVPLPAAAGEDANEWYKLPVPEAGGDGDWVLTGDIGAGASGVTAVAAGYDGSIFAAVEAAADTQFDGYNLFRSTDGGYTWQPLWKIPDGDGDTKLISIVLPSPGDTDVLYAATGNNVYKSTNGGRRFSSLGSPAGAGQQITSIAVAGYGNDNIVYAGVRAAGAGEFGGLYFRNEAELFQSWADLNVGNVAAGTAYDVLAVAASPDFDEDEQVVAVITDEANTYVTTKYESAGWGADTGNAVIPGMPATGASIALPVNYSSDVGDDLYIQYVGLNAGTTGGIYIIGGAEAPANSLAVPVLYGVPVYSIDAAGEAFPLDVIIGGGLDEETASLVYTPAAVVAGLTTGGVVSISSGLAYTPPGTATATNACVAVGEFQSSVYAYMVYAGTSGFGGGFARSVDSGANFARTGLMCDEIAGVEALAVSPVYDDDSTVYMITRRTSGVTLLWRTTDAGDTWEVILAEGQLISDTGGDTALVSSLESVALSPRFGTDTTVFVLESGTEPDIWRSTDYGVQFWPLETPATGDEVDVWEVTGLKEIMVGDSLGYFYTTTNGGLTWRRSDTGASGFSDMTLSPDYEDDETILMVGTGGEVWLSDDGGKDWRERDGFGSAGDDARVAAFHPEYAGNGLFYAAGVSGGSLIVQRYDKDDGGWEDVSPDTLAGTTGATGIGLSDDGTMYVTDGSVPGMFRTLDGLEEFPYWEQVSEGIGTAVLDSLKVTGDGNVCWGIGSDDAVWIYRDILTGTVTLTAPADGAATNRVDRADLSWREVDGALTYEVEYDTDSGFEQNPVSLFGELPSQTVTGLDDGRTYYWHVRVVENSNNEPMRSRWSATWAFTTDLGAGEWNPFIGGVPEAPPNGAIGIQIRPTFAWNAADWADGYEFILAGDAAFTEVVVSKTGTGALPATVYQCDTRLEEATTYYWKVRAVSQTSASEWATAVFTTEEKITNAVPGTATPTPVPVPATPDYIWVIIAVGGALVITIVVLIFRNR